MVLPTCMIVGVNGRVLETDTFASNVGGSTFVSLSDENGRVLGHWSLAQWSGTREAAMTVLRELASAASEGRTVEDDDYGLELCWVLPGGEMRAAVDGDYVRFLDGDGPVEGGSAYWDADEFVDDPELVMGAVCGTAAELRDL